MTQEEVVVDYEHPSMEWLYRFEAVRKGKSQTARLVRVCKIEEYENLIKKEGQL